MSLISPLPSPGLPGREKLSLHRDPHFDPRMIRTNQSTRVVEESLLDRAEELLFDNLVTEDDEPVDNLFSAKQQRLLVEPLYSSWMGPADGSPFLADANIGVFHTLKEPPLVPDMFLSLNVQVAQDWWQKQHRSYFYREFGKPPEVVIEIVSNREGEEDGSKFWDYARMKIRYYIIFDPQEELREGVLRVYELHQGAYVLKTTNWLAKVGLGVTLWTGTFEGKHENWLRWCGKDKQVIPTGAERAAQADLRVQQEHHEKELALSHLKQERRQKKQERHQKEQALSQVEQERHQKEQERHQKEQALSQVEQERRQKEQERHQKEQALSQLEQERLHKERLMAQLRALGVEP